MKQVEAIATLVAHANPERVQAAVAAINNAFVDAARYQHLRNKPMEVPANGLDVAQWDDGGGEGVRGEALDALVDEERRKAGTL